MRVVVQRVSRGKVTVHGEPIGEIGPGLVVLLGVGDGDCANDAGYLAEKIANLRIFGDQDGKMNCSALELGLPLLVVSQFTLYGDCRKGRRPDFSGAAAPEIAENLYEFFGDEAIKLGLRVVKGRFRSQMIVEIINDGPVTVLLDSHKQF
jgi:D-tyrosyl-tRNA(Tyr) deacylase